VQESLPIELNRIHPGYPDSDKIEIPINIHKKNYKSQSCTSSNPGYPDSDKKIPKNPYTKRLSTPFPFPTIAFLLFVLE
jgi:hypothetical protein